MKILKFYADWCQPCKMLSKKLEGINTEYEIEEVNIVERTDLKEAYGIRGIPTMVKLDSSGAEVERLVGIPGIEELQDWLE